MKPTPTVSIAISDELVEAVAARVLERLGDREGSGAADQWLRGAQQIADHLGCSPSRVYQLVSARRIPVHKDGAALIARQSELDAWLKEGGNRCP